MKCIPLRILYVKYICAYIYWALQCFWANEGRESMKKNRFALGIAAIVIAIAGATAAPASEAVAAESHVLDGSRTSGMNDSTPNAEAPRTARKVCNYVHGARCVTWVTTLHSCHNIFQNTRDADKLKACAIYASKGIVTAWP